MFHPKHFGVIVHFFMSLVISIVLSIMMPLMATGNITVNGFIRDLIISFCISFVVGLIIPAKKLGDALAGMFKLREHSFPATLVSTAVQTFIFATIITLVMVCIGAGIGPHTIFAWLGVYPTALAVIYVISLIFAPIAVGITKKLVKLPDGAGH